MPVHLREPGQEWKETVAAGTMAGGAGGFTAVACMANSEPVNDNRSVTEHILAEARRHGYARVHPIGAVSKQLAGLELAEIGEMVRAGAVAVSDDGRPVMNAELVRRRPAHAAPLWEAVEQADARARSLWHGRVAVGEGLS